MALIERYVDTGSAAGGDGTTAATSSGDNTHAYQSLNAWEAAEQTDLDTANNTHTVHCNRTNAGGIDQLECTVNGWTTSATDFITITADDFPADGIYDATLYLLENNDDSASALGILEDYVRIVNLQVLDTVTAAARDAIVIAAVGTSDIRIDSCIIKGNCNGTALCSGINCADADATVTVFNTIFTGFISGDNPADVSFAGIIVQNSTLVKIYNCTFYGNYRGIRQSAGTISTINCLSFNNTDDFSGTVNADYCASDDGDGTNAKTITQSADDWAALVVDAAGDDFHVTNTSSELYQTGNGATPKATFTDDIIGTTRDAVDLNWDIGAYELIAAVGGIVILRRRIGGY